MAADEQHQMSYRSIYIFREQQHRLPAGEDVEAGGVWIASRAWATLQSSSCT